MNKYVEYLENEIVTLGRLRDLIIHRSFTTAREILLSEEIGAELYDVGYIGFRAFEYLPFDIDIKTKRGTLESAIGELSHMDWLAILGATVTSLAYKEDELKQIRYALSQK